MIIQLEPLISDENKDLTFHDIENHYTVGLRQFYTWVMKKKDPRTVVFLRNLKDGLIANRSFKETRKRVMKIDQDEVDQLSCACKFEQCRGSLNFFKGEPCRKVFLYINRYMQ